MTAPFTHRRATLVDLPELHIVMDLAIRRLVGAYLDAARVEASFEIMGVDTQLIEDGTYFVVEQGRRIVGCGGWSRRATLFGGDHTEGRDARPLDPEHEPARVRAMYTHPDFVRRGVGRLVLALCETAAAAEGFRSVELVATVSGEPLYLACGYSMLERLDVRTSMGLSIPCARMRKELTTSGGQGRTGLVLALLLAVAAAACGRSPLLAEGPIQLSPEPTTVPFSQPLRPQGPAFELCFDFDRPKDSLWASSIQAMLISGSGARVPLGDIELDRHGESIVCQIGRVDPAEYTLVELVAGGTVRIRGIRGG